MTRGQLEVMWEGEELRDHLPNTAGNIAAGTSLEELSVLNGPGNQSQILMWHGESESWEGHDGPC
jgi:hypothetical protein